MQNLESIEYQWPYIARMIGSDELIEESALRLGALCRRREIKTGDQLLRLAMIYGFCGHSLRQTAAYAQTSAIANVSDVAVLKRLRKAGDWLGFLLASKLAERAAAALPERNLRIRIVDASTVSRNGAKGTDYRLHFGMNLARFLVDQLEVTDVHGGERIDRFDFSPGDLVLADRGYSNAPTFVRLHAVGAAFVIRMNWQNLRLETSDGADFELMPALRALPEAAVGEFAAMLRSGGHRIPVRIVAIRKSEPAAEAARRKSILDRSRKNRKLDPRTLEFAGFTFVITNTTNELLSAADVLELYRFRWQIELVFKRLKSILNLDDLPAKDPALARTWLFAKLLGALAIEDLTERYLAFSPWGYSHLGPAHLPLADSPRPS